MIASNNQKFNNIVLGWDSDRLADWMECLGYFNVYNIINGWIFKDVVNNILINWFINIIKLIFAVKKQKKRHAALSRTDFCENSAHISA